MHHKFNPERAEKLIAPERYHELKPDILLQRLASPPGNTILDLGCGNGFFTFPAAAAMGENGMVIAADTSPEMLELLQRRNPPDNVQVLSVEEVKLDIEDDSVDGIVTIALYHEFVEPQANLEEMKRVLKPNGRILFLDWNPEAVQEQGPRHEHRVDLQTAVRDVEAAGFTMDIAENYTEDHWIIIAHMG